MTMFQMRLAVVDGKMYAIAGYNGETRLKSKSIEVYDDESDSWRPCGSMNYERDGFDVGIV